MFRRSREPLGQPEALESILSRAGENRFARARAPIVGLHPRTVGLAPRAPGASHLGRRAQALYVPGR